MVIVEQARIKVLFVREDDNHFGRSPNVWQCKVCHDFPPCGSRDISKNLNFDLNVLIFM